MTIARLAFNHVSCLRGDRLLFDAMRFALEPGEAALVIGPNGSGKSSLLRIAAGLLAPAAGTISRQGQIAWLGEQASLDGQLPLERALEYWAGIDGANKQSVASALSAMAIAPLAEVPVRMLSTGQRRRAALARVIISDAPIWLLDEPGNGLDAAALTLLALAIADHRARGGIVIAATHQDIGMPDAMILDLRSAS